MASRKKVSEFGTQGGARRPGIKHVANTTKKVQEVRDYTREIFENFEFDGITLTRAQIDELKQIQYQNGTPFFSFDRPDNVYNSKDIRNNYTGLTNLVDFLESVREVGYDKALDLVDESLKKTSLLFRKTKGYQNVMEQVEEDRDLETRVEGRNDIGECLSCGSKIIIVRSVQARCADEATSIIYRCASCGAGGGRIRLRKLGDTK